MNAPHSKCDTAWKYIEKEVDVPRTDATFTEIYELIFYNRTMVRSELAALLQIIQKKLMETAEASSALTGGDIYWTCGEETAAAMIRPAFK